MGLIVRASIIPLDDGTILLTNAITAEELLKRWPGIAEFELAELMDKNILQGYSIIVPLRGRDGKPHYRCSRGGSFTRAGDEYLWHGTCFDIEAVEAIETERSHYKYERLADGETQTPTTPEWIPCDTLANRWGWSPFDVVKLLNSGAIPFHNYWNHAPYVEGLQEFSVHQVDLLRWESANADKIGNAPVRAKDGGHLFAGKMEELEKQNAALRSELEAERAKPHIEPHKLSKTAPATEAASSKRAEEWKGYAAQMVKIALDCEREGPQARKRPQLQAIAKRHGGELPTTALEVLWAALPDKHRSKEPGPQRQG